MTKITMESLAQASNPLSLQALFYTDGCKSHLDLGSNDGRTLRGLDPSTITAVELFGPSVETLRKAGIEVFQQDVREYCRYAIGEDKPIPPSSYSGMEPMVTGYVRVSHHYDRVTAFDVIEHIPRRDGERLLDQIEQIATREIVVFMPIETPELEATERWQQYREEGLAQHPDAQRDLQDHLSQWAPADFQKRGYLTLLMPNFHYEGFGAFFAAKYKRPEDQATILARVQAWAEEQTKPKAQTWGHLGAGSGVAQPLLLNGIDRMFLGDGVGIGYGSRIECISSYGGVKHSPTLVIGDGVTAEFFLHIGCAERVVIGRDCMIAGNVYITDHQHGYDTSRPLHGQPLTVKPVEIGDSVFIGEGAQIMPGAKIGDHAVIGAHSVVTGEIPAYAVAAGAPAREIRRLDWHKDRPLVSIVIPTIADAGLLNADMNIDMPRVFPSVTEDAGRLRLWRCLDSIKAHTPEPYEILVTEDAEHRGFAASCNRGIVQAKGNFVLLLNDDAEVTPDWLSRMLAVMDASPDVGLVGPVSNNVSGLQCREPIPGPVSQQVSRLVGFCLLIRRSVIDKIGGLDTSFGLNFEDDDFCLRAQAAGFKCRIALDSFVHHDCHATFTELGINGNELMAKAWPIFAAKWGAAAIPDGYRVQIPAFSLGKCYIPLGAEAIAATR